MKTRKTRLTFLIVLVIGMTACCAMEYKTSRMKLKPLTDGVYQTSGENGRWVKGCENPRPDRCNLGVGNLGPKYTYHWE